MLHIRAVRKIHRWMGLILAPLIVIEAITGLMLAEPWIIGRQSLGSSTLIKWAVMLHIGIIGDYKLTWVIDIIAIGLVVLTLTGIYLSVPFLRAKYRHRKNG